jgi:hypothetical protein
MSSRSNSNNNNNRYNNEEEEEEENFIFDNDYKWMTAGIGFGFNEYALDASDSLPTKKNAPSQTFANFSEFKKFLHSAWISKYMLEKKIGKIQDMHISIKNDSNWKIDLNVTKYWILTPFVLDSYVNRKLNAKEIKENIVPNYDCGYIYEIHVSPVGKNPKPSKIFSDIKKFDATIDKNGMWDKIMDEKLDDVSEYMKIDTTSPKQSQSPSTSKISSTPSRSSSTPTRTSSTPPSSSTPARSPIKPMPKGKPAAAEIINTGVKISGRPVYFTKGLKNPMASFFVKTTNGKKDKVLMKNVDATVKASLTKVLHKHAPAAPEGKVLNPLTGRYVKATAAKPKTAKAPVKPTTNKKEKKIASNPYILEKRIDTPEALYEYLLKTPTRLRYVGGRPSKIWDKITYYDSRLGTELNIGIQSISSPQEMASGQIEYDIRISLVDSSFGYGSVTLNNVKSQGQESRKLADDVVKAIRDKTSAKNWGQSSHLFF